MAQGTGLVFHRTPYYIRNKIVDWSAGTWRMILCSDPVTALLVTETNPARGSTNINEVSAGGGYSTGGILLSLANADTGGVSRLSLDTGVHTSGILAWTAGAGSPTNIKTAVLIDDAATSPVDAAVKYWDLTEDGGTTPLDLTGVDINLTVGTGAGENVGDLLIWPVNP